jgi:hypothetical protein
MIPKTVNHVKLTLSDDQDQDKSNGDFDDQNNADVTFVRPLLPG